ncbi:hypothetical protein IU500_35080 [Nocardia terpenica]|uniref:hypothetical protein n=1 Tax=Nocardia terpenica TaxID=455432 RepID=UPI0018947E80|nr:hypothetical protein [Nocardia terpenica]MBF6066069.1 hypothetical protein [Nocardia terpenica]MBF6109240.1 hypothetical protein [Nocardia terpenica]MBF6116313.1 hypothetical protein [Nocardia terpenica]MBF6123470.1 hypothetical protein [Nocardia terpenica]MBF6156747.1 hypothetical protein [Nocardia terpenica]
MGDVEPLVAEGVWSVLAERGIDEPVDIGEIVSGGGESGLLDAEYVGENTDPAIVHVGQMVDLGCRCRGGYLDGRCGSADDLPPAGTEHRADGIRQLTTGHIGTEQSAQRHDRHTRHQAAAWPSNDQSRNGVQTAYLPFTKNLGKQTAGTTVRSTDTRRVSGRIRSSNGSDRPLDTNQPIAL